MFVKRLVLNDFRNYASAEVLFQNGSIYITGPNGIGKTNILEAIYYLTLGRSFRKAEDEDLIRKGAKEASIYLEYHSEKDNSDHVVSCVIGKDYKVFAYDKEKVKSLSKILGKLLAVYYDPSLVFFFKGEPEQRRRLLDETLSQLSPEYLYALARYKKLLKERNAALVQNYDSDIIDVLRNQLINLSYRIVKDRKDLIRDLSAPTADVYQKLFGERRELKLVYKTSSPLDDDEESFVKKSLELFKGSKSLENIRRQTLIGPHRDDLTAWLDQNDLSAYGSQGENRLASLSLKTAIRGFLAKKLGDTPIFLLDDVTSDLDDIRTANLLQVIHDGQVYVTGTMIRNGFESYQIYDMNGKTITRRITK
jgi:DNA replication and repair protein RecF